MQLTSSAFDEGGSVPSRFTCDGDDLAPPLAWSGVPEGTAAFALIVEDPDARGFVHWLLTDLAGNVREVAEGAGDEIGTPGRNDFGRAGWGGPCPPSGEHRYLFTLYALDEPLGADATSAAAARSRMEGHVLAQATLTGRYRRG